MSRYIDADKLTFSRVRIIHPDGTAGGWNAVVMSSVINNAPTADVVEVRHGEWETIPDCQPNRLLAYRHICSVCKTTYKDLNCHGHNYCHWCGAKMDGKENNDV